MKKKILIIILVLIILGLICGIYVYYLKTRHVNVLFELLGDSNIELEVGMEYEELGYKLIVNEKEVKDDVKISNNIDIKKLGDYNVVYTYIDKYKERHEITRNVKIVDKICPQISLKGDANIAVLLNEKFEDPGYEVTDNYDNDLEKLVKIDSNLDTSKKGEYTIKYSVSDSSLNKTEITRKIKVVEPKPVVTYTETKSTEKSTNTSQIKKSYSNTITKNSFKSDGIYIKGYVKDSNGNYIIKLKDGDNVLEYKMDSIDDNNYSGTITLKDVSNGVYKAYIVSTNEERLLNKMESIDQIIRSKVGDKLVTVKYDNSNVEIKVEDFSYQYDILLDPGHGGNDSGAINKYIYEKEMNLIQSKYEKCRYEEHGYSVYMIRNDDTYGKLMGDSSWRNLSRRSYTIGYYGVVSRIVYSNHHNSNSSSKLSGYEILTPAQYDNIDAEIAIANKFNEIYPLQENHNRVYTRDYESEAMYSTFNKQQYNIKNYYATIRIPYELFNVKSITYEGCYMSNYNDYNWYWNEGNWKKLSEIKIEEYVKSLGGSYNPSTNCN